MNGNIYSKFCMVILKRLAEAAKYRNFFSSFKSRKIKDPESLLTRDTYCS